VKALEGQMKASTLCWTMKVLDESIHLMLDHSSVTGTVCFKLSNLSTQWGARCLWRTISL